MDILNELQRNANLLTAVFTFGLFWTAILAKTAWKDEIKTKRRKDLADKLLNAVNFLEFQFGLKFNESERSIEYDKALEKWGISCQNPIQRLKKIKIELDDIKNEYNALNKNFMQFKISKIINYIDINIDFIDKIIKKGNAEFLTLSDVKNCKTDKLKDFCIKEKKKFYY